MFPFTERLIQYKRDQIFQPPLFVCRRSTSQCRPGWRRRKPVSSWKLKTPGRRTKPGGLVEMFESRNCLPRVLACPKLTSASCWIVHVIWNKIVVWRKYWINLNMRTWKRRDFSWGWPAGFSALPLSRLALADYPAMSFVFVFVFVFVCFDSKYK